MSSDLSSSESNVTESQGDKPSQPAADVASATPASPEPAPAGGEHEAAPSVVPAVEPAVVPAVEPKSPAAEPEVSRPRPPTTGFRAS